MKMKSKFNLQDQLVNDSVFTIGSVFSVKGKDIAVKVNKDKNLPHLFFNGRTIKNVSVGLSNYVKIIKGFTEIICKVEGEYLEEDKYQTSKKYKIYSVRRITNKKTKATTNNTPKSRSVKKFAGRDAIIVSIRNLNTCHSERNVV